MKKITRSTIKSFAKKNFDNLYIRVNSRFDGMTDCIEQRNEDFTKVEADNRDFYKEDTLGIKGVWLVGNGRDYFYKYEELGFKGFEVRNSCGCFVLAVKV